MYSSEEWCSKISNIIGNELDLNKEKILVINYGLFAIIQILISIILVIVFGSFFKVVDKALIILISISILRQSSGGVHASSPSTCTMIGTVWSVGMAVLINQKSFEFVNSVLLTIIIFILGYYILYKLAPVDSSAKPIRTESKRIRLKKRSILILSVYLLVVILNFIGYYLVKKEYLLNYSQCISIGVLWQIFSLTSIGHVVLGKLDAFFNKTKIERG